MRKSKAFTLIELLTVMAITAVLMTLIVLPIFQSFNLTRTAQAFADAQDKARILVEKISREVGNAVSVRDSADTLAIIDPAKPEGVVLPYTKLDLISPAQGDPSARDASGAFINPRTGKADPTLTRPIGDIRLPVSAGMTFTRWWVGLNNPAQDYNEPYTGILMARNGKRDNLFVLRRAEIQPFIYRPRKDGAQNSTAWRPNLAYFRSDDQASGSTAEFDTRIIDLDDPRFFVADGLYLPDGAKDVLANRLPDADKNTRVANWNRAGVLQTEVSRYDMVRPVLTGSPPQPVKNPDGSVNVVPLVQFRPTRVSNAPASGSAAAQPGRTGEGLDQVGPDTFQTERGLWTNAIVRFYTAERFAPGGLEIASVNQLGGITISYGGYNATGLDGIHDAPDNFALFDLLLYERLVARGDAYPFTKAAVSADQSDLASPSPNRLWTPEESQRRIFTPFRVVTAQGRIVTSFPIEQVGKVAINDPNLNPNAPNLPYVVSRNASSPALDTGVGAAFSPVGDGALFTSRTYDPNRLFNYVWNAYPAYQGTWQRFIDLRFVRNADGTRGPLYPFAASGEVTGFDFPTGRGGTRNRVRIVPGSDVVFGPDQTPGAGYGTIVRYTRVTGNPGPNQYRMVYADLPEPTNGDPNSSNYGNVDYSILGYPTTGEFAGFSPLSYDGSNLMSAAVQARYKAGYVQLCSDPNVPIPAYTDPQHPGTITVNYRFQFNGPSDSFVVDHDTREVMQILLTIKNYPQSNAPQAQTITLKSTATLRNALR